MKNEKFSNNGKAILVFLLLIILGLLLIGLNSRRNNKQEVIPQEPTLIKKSEVHVLPATTAKESTSESDKTSETIVTNNTLVLEFKDFKLGFKEKP